MFIRSGNKFIEIKDSMQAIKLEIKFNCSDNANKWREIGDALYDFKDINVDSSQFYFIRDLVMKHLNPLAFTIVL
jgi:hypothetical protein